MNVAGSIALVTGANRGLGLAFARALLEKGAATVYAAARKPEAVTLRGVVALKLDVTSEEDVNAAVRAAGDIDLRVNNAGIARPGGFLTEGAVEAAREQYEVNFFGRSAWRVPSPLYSHETAAARSSTCFPSQVG